MVSLRDDDVIWWAGWETSWKKLRSAGWATTIKPRYSNWRQPTDSAASNEKIYIRHPISRQMGRIILNAQNTQCGYYELDFLIQEHNQSVTPPKILNERELVEGDISGLMELILGLQKKNVKKSKPKESVTKQAEILILKQA